MNKQEEQEQGDGAQVESFTVSLKKTTLINLWIINATCCICTGILVSMLHIEGNDTYDYNEYHLRYKVDIDINFSLFLIYFHLLLLCIIYFFFFLAVLIFSVLFFFSSYALF